MKDRPTNAFEYIDDKETELKVLKSIAKAPDRFELLAGLSHHEEQKAKP